MFPLVEFDLEEIWERKTAHYAGFQRTRGYKPALEWDIKWDDAKEEAVTMIFNDVQD
jgi:hypothetical protein